MIPIHGPIYGAVFAVASRMASGESELSEDDRRRLERARENVEELSELVGDLSPTKPGSWGRFAGRIIDHSLGEQPTFDSAQQARDLLGFDVAWPLPAELLEQVDDGLRREVVFRDDGCTLIVTQLAEAIEVCLEFGRGSRDGGVLYYRSDGPTRSAVQRAVTDELWCDRQGLQLDWTKGEPAVGPLDLHRHQYHGEHVQLIERWRAFRREGFRRNVLLQGPPGCGKTTLCCHAARELGERVVLATPEVVANATLSEWNDLLEVLDPEVLIVDDIDRLGDRRGRDLDAKLKFFEEGFCDIPLVLFTSNDHTRIPAAMRRPGRIDRFVEFDEPDEAVRRQIVERLADREGVDIPDGQMPRLMELLDQYSPAHVVEALRRARVCGWENSCAGDDEFRFQRHYDGFNDWLRLHGYRRLDTQARFVFEQVETLADVQLTYEDDRSRLFRIELPNGARLVVEDNERRGGSEVFFRPDVDGKSKLCDGIAQLFWQNRGAVLLDVVRGDDVRCQPMQLNRRSYYGPLIDAIDDWRRFRAEGLRRSVLLQGPPGCGKSTFCMHAARELSQRTVMLTPQFYQEVRCGQWRAIVDFLQPEMVIVDDVDRVNDHSLEAKLRLFEEGWCDIPFVLFTTNDHEKLPRPMRRPGRIDQIIEVDPPEKPLRWKLIRQMAEREGLDEVPEQHLETLDGVLQHQSTAHLVELLRRAKVLDWHTALHPCDGDATFEHADDDTTDDNRRFA